MDHCCGAWYCPVAPSCVTGTGIQLLKSHTVLHISQQSPTLDSHLQTLISFLSSVQVKASFDPPDVKQGPVNPPLPSVIYMCLSVMVSGLLGGAP